MNQPTKCLVRHLYDRYLSIMAQDGKRSPGISLRPAMMSFSRAPVSGGQFDQERLAALARQANARRAIADEARGAVLARIIHGAAASSNQERLEDVSDLSDDDFISRMTR